MGTDVGEVLGAVEGAAVGSAVGAVVGAAVGVGEATGKEDVLGEAEGESGVFRGVGLEQALKPNVKLAASIKKIVSFAMLNSFYQLQVIIP